ncbi:hypothetical protein [Virgisporangium aurantiacum]|uniref:Fibronectin type-III domain-containing protein n=1 Tax=Virgisporangium aurantiacum TaxID=175570 RepID=A0A8J4DZV1_9ACTN|nr:hypothetical protein [Virgisporangium aurantiacum]GIJ56334.1 hypothetical protein Vau01_038500 [Virgisporangium aurantiacum]
MTFDANDYRKRVLAAVEARGGMPASDPFEWYDVPLDKADLISDDEVVTQVEAVWAFWQKNRNHPKYRGLVTALLEAHGEIAPAMCERLTRLQLAGKTRTSRAERDEERFVDLDAAIERLVERFGGIPRSKRAGVLAFAAQAGVDQASAEARMARHPVIDDEPTAGQPAPMSEVVFRQVKANLEELGRILGRPAFVSLYDLLGLDPTAPRPVLANAREVYAARNRELRPDRRRALVDDLLASVTALLLDSDPEAYLDMLLQDVTARLRPRVSAAVLVEDELTADDYEHMVSEAEALGLDHGRAVKAVSTLARELGVAVPQPATQPARTPSSGVPRPGSVQPPVGQTIRPPSTYTPAPSTPPPPPPPSRPDRFARPGRTPAGGAAPTASPRAWHDKLSEARAALRAGRVTEAQAKVEEARQLAGGTMPPIRAIADEAANVLTEATQRWAAAVAALAARRYTEATGILERIQAIAVDVAGPNGRSVADALAEAHRGTETASAALEHAATLPGQARELALLSALNAAPDHPGLIAALHEIGVQPPGDVRTRMVSGGLVISWAPSTSPGQVEYRIQRVGPDGKLLPVGTTHRPELEVAAPRPGEPTPVYVVVARRAGVVSAEVRSDAPGRASQSPVTPAASPATSTPAAPSATVAQAAAVAPVSVPPGPLPVPVESLAVLPHGKRVRLVYPVPATGHVEIRRLPDGVRPPTAGSLVSDPSTYGEVVPGMGPGLAVDRRPSGPTRYLALTVDGAAVAGPVTWYLELPPVTNLRVTDALVQWDWPAGCTEVMLVWRADAPPESAGDPAAAGTRKVTNTRYTLDGGFALPADRPLHVAAFSCTRMGGTLAVATNAAVLSVS